MRQTSIGIANQRKIRCLTQIGKQCLGLFRTKSAVKTDRIGAKRLQHGHRRQCVRTVEQLSASIEHQGNIDRQIAGFLRRKHRRLHLIRITEGFQQYAISPGFRSCFYHLGKYGYRLFKFEISQWAKELSRWADVHRNKGLPATPLLRLPRQQNAFADRLRCRMPRPGKLEPVGSERIGFEYIAAGPKIPAVNICNHFRMIEIPALKAYLKEHGVPVR